MISPSDRVPERGLDWFSVATEPCGGGTSDLGLPRRVFEYLGIYSAKRGCGRPPRWAQPTWACQGDLAQPGGWCPPDLWGPCGSSRPSPKLLEFLIFQKKLQKVASCLDFCRYGFSGKPKTRKKKKPTLRTKLIG